MSTAFFANKPAHLAGDPAWLKVLITGSLLAVALISGAPLFGSPVWRGKSAEQNHPKLLASLRRSILGHRKTEIVARLGLPRAVSTGHTPAWYYTLNQSRRIAMAIVFEHERARAVEFFESPTI